MCDKYFFNLSWAFSADWELPSVCLQRYLISWCDTTKFSYCYTLNSTNVTGTQTQFKTTLFAGDTYTFYVRALTAYGEGKESNLQVSVPPLDLQVSYFTGHTIGRYRLQIHLHWYRWSIPYGQEVVSKYVC